MKKRLNFSGCLIGAAGLIVLILDNRTAMNGAQEGISLCIRTVIPSLFPFFFLSNLLSSALIGRKIPFLRPINRLCRIPDGAEYILLSGLLGGYPVGAQSIGRAHLSDQDARRMMAFCNNCGPAFLFGMSAVLFEDPLAPWALFAIHISSALITGMIIPGKPQSRIDVADNAASPVHALQQALRSMAGVCGWVVLFRVLISFLEKWLLWYFPTEIRVAICGFLEISNGCIGLTEIEHLPLRFVLCSVFLGFGGLCVTMQTYFAAANVNKGLYFPGKLLQASVSASVACLLVGSVYFLIPLTLSLVLTYILRKTEKRCRNLQTSGV